jgi:hypothetical protein
VLRRSGWDLFHRHVLHSPIEFGEAVLRARVPPNHGSAARVSLGGTGLTVGNRLPALDADGAGCVPEMPHHARLSTIARQTGHVTRRGSRDSQVRRPAARYGLHSVARWSGRLAWVKTGRLRAAPLLEFVRLMSACRSTRFPRTVPQR